MSLLSKNMLIRAVMIQSLSVHYRYRNQQICIDSGRFQDIYERVGTIGKLDDVESPPNRSPITIGRLELIAWLRLVFQNSHCYI